MVGVHQPKRHIGPEEVSYHRSSTVLENVCVIESEVSLHSVVCYVLDVEKIEPEPSVRRNEDSIR